VLPLKEVIGLRTGPETIDRAGVQDGLEIDLVTHDAKKFFNLLLKKNGYVLEQVLSPLVVHTTPEHAELKEIAVQCITRHHAHHYFGFAETQWKLFEKENPPRVKPFLYVYRVLLTGIHLMQTGAVEANLLRLNETARLPYLDDLQAAWCFSAEVTRSPRGCTPSTTCSSSGRWASGLCSRPCWRIGCFSSASGCTRGIRCITVVCPIISSSSTLRQTEAGLPRPGRAARTARRDRHPHGAGRPPRPCDHGRALWAHRPVAI
jgi:hypothetical protein